MVSAYTRTTVPFADFYKQRVRWHLSGAGVGLPLGDLSQLEAVMEQIPNTWARCQVYEALDRCDQAWEETRRGLAGMVATEAEAITGDITRTTARSKRSPRAYDDLMQIYKTAVSELARRLWTHNWSNPGNDPYRYSGMASGYTFE